MNELKAENELARYEKELEAELYRGKSDAMKLRSELHQQQEATMSMCSALAEEQQSAEYYMQEVETQKRRHDLLREQLVDAERCIQKLQDAAQEVAALAYDDAMEYEPLKDPLECADQDAAGSAKLTEAQGDGQHLTGSTTSGAGSPDVPSAFGMSTTKVHHSEKEGFMAAADMIGETVRAVSAVKVQALRSYAVVSPRSPQLVQTVQRVPCQRSLSPLPLVRTEVLGKRSLSPPLVRTEEPSKRSLSPSLVRDSETSKSTLQPILRVSENPQVRVSENPQLKSAAWEIPVEAVQTKRSVSPANPYQRVVQRCAQNVQGLTAVQRVYVTGHAQSPTLPQTVQMVKAPEQIAGGGAQRIPVQMQACTTIQRPRSQEVTARPRPRVCTTGARGLAR